MQRAIWLSYRAAVTELTIGKRLPGAVYVHRSAVSHLPSLLRDELTRAAVAARLIDSWNVVKFHTKRFAISFLTYSDFDSDPHPVLQAATIVNLQTGLTVDTNYSRRENPPILHRKEYEDDNASLTGSTKLNEPRSGPNGGGNEIRARKVSAWTTLDLLLNYTFNLPPPAPAEVPGFAKDGGKNVKDKDGKEKNVVPVSTAEYGCSN